LSLIQLCGQNSDLINIPVFVLLQNEDGQKLFSDLLYRYTHIAANLKLEPKTPENKESALLSLILTAMSVTITDAVRNGIDPQELFNSIYPTRNRNLNKALSYFYTEVNRSRFELVASSLFNRELPTNTTFKSFFESIGVSISTCSPSSKKKYEALKVYKTYSIHLEGSTLYLVIPEFNKDNVQESLNAYIIEIPTPKKITHTEAKSNKYYKAVPFFVSAVSIALIVIQHRVLSKK
jgi:hypothetical protein